ncbi:unnamed protein product [Oppiella nova]|uniref:Uncharacterized protein n=1 Tax=Oppiella nova TaxID=334625 RepID=A0A7R9QPI5_9ACAR|nr:unnamed protein product [Oppiella nova]CAG2170285.1 unnamed protein product [Oppiella nova]
MAGITVAIILTERSMNTCLNHQLQDIKAHHHVTATTTTTTDKGTVDSPDRQPYKPRVHCGERDVITTQYLRGQVFHLLLREGIVPTTHTEPDGQTPLHGLQVLFTPALMSKIM